MYTAESDSKVSYTNQQPTAMAAPDLLYVILSFRETFMGDQFNCTWGYLGIPGVSTLSALIRILDPPRR